VAPSIQILPILSLNKQLFPAVNCSDPPHIPFAQQSSNDSLYQSMINYTCNEGHLFPSGSKYNAIKCNASAMWEGDMQTGCEGIYYDY